MEITKGIVFLCERRETLLFLAAYLRWLRKQNELLPEVQLLQFASLRQLGELLAAMASADNLTRLRQLAIFCDATDKPQKRRRLAEIIKDLSPLRHFHNSACYFFPGRKANGSWQAGGLETFLLTIINQKEFGGVQFTSLRQSAREFLANAATYLAYGKDELTATLLREQTKQKEKPEQSLMLEIAREKKQATLADRRLLYAILACNYKYAGLGVASAQIGAFCFDSENLADLHKFILTVCTGEKSTK